MPCAIFGSSRAAALIWIMCGDPSHLDPLETSDSAAITCTSRSIVDFPAVPSREAGGCSPIEAGRQRHGLRQKTRSARPCGASARRLELISRLSLEGFKSQIDADCLDLPGLRIRPRFKTDGFAFGDFIAFSQC